MPSEATMIGPYRLLRLLGQGSQAQVHLAEHSHSAQIVALKLVPLTAATDVQRQAYAQEVLTMRSLVHPDIVATLDAGVEGELGWLAMEFVAGTSLDRHTLPSALLPQLEVIRLTRRLAVALAHAHRLGIVHRDIKPANVLFDRPSHTLKLADFGLARAANSVHTATGMMLGSPAYMAPEQLAGEAPSAQSDLYALGVTMFELLTGRRPHEGRSMGELLRQVANATAPSLLSLRPASPPAVSALLARLLSRAALARPPGAQELAAELQLLEDELASDSDAVSH